MPTLEVLNLEHRLREDDFVGLAASAPIVPKARARIFATRLRAGYDGDFVTALHILVPQLENLVRHHLKVTGALATHMDQDGVETENGLSTLMAMPEATRVFGESLCFEIKALFCFAYGPNCATTWLTVCWTTAAALRPKASMRGGSCSGWSSRTSGTPSGDVAHGQGAEDAEGATEVTPPAAAVRAPMAPEIGAAAAPGATPTESPRHSNQPLLLRRGQKGRRARLDEFPGVQSGLSRVNVARWPAGCVPEDRIQAAGVVGALTGWRF
jgi:hypothetical protein